ncbi:hypothetical protein R1flu_012520 [Riccia fluitans]|uniref:Uncharacterized protein n=1 Tax=Riccia fluitans TaxID=41844 RepID=A0ABD1ZB34_9MARC
MLGMKGSLAVSGFMPRTLWKRDQSNTKPVEIHKSVPGFGLTPPPLFGSSLVSTDASRYPAGVNLLTGVESNGIVIRFQYGVGQFRSVLFDSSYAPGHAVLTAYISPVE